MQKTTLSALVKVLSDEDNAKVLGLPTWLVGATTRVPVSASDNRDLAALCGDSSHMVSVRYLVGGAGKDALGTWLQFGESSDEDVLAPLFSAVHHGGEPLVVYLLEHVLRVFDGDGAAVAGHLGRFVGCNIDEAELYSDYLEETLC